MVVAGAGGVSSKTGTVFGSELSDDCDDDALAVVGWTVLSGAVALLSEADSFAIVTSLGA